MGLNPGGIVLLVVGVVMVLVGVRGSQSQVFAAVTGKAGATRTLASSTNFMPGPKAPSSSAATQTAPQTWLA